MKRVALCFLPLVIGCSLEATGIERADASTGDALAPEGGPPLTSWCSTTGAGHDFCADFDVGLLSTEPGAWCKNAAPKTAACNSVENGGTVALDKAISSSAPSSLAAKTMLGGAASQAFLTRDFPGVRHPLKLAFDVQVDATGLAQTTIAAITLEIVGGPHRVSLLVLPPGDAGPDAHLAVVEKPLGGAPTMTTLLLTLPPKKFARVELIVGIAPNTVTVTVDGTSSSALTIDAPGEDAIGRSVQLGLDSTPADAWQLHFDDVTFDFTK